MHFTHKIKANNLTLGSDPRLFPLLSLSLYICIITLSNNISTDETCNHSTPLLAPRRIHKADRKRFRISIYFAFTKKKNQHLGWHWNEYFS